MDTTTATPPDASARTAPRRRVRNFLLDTSLQLRLAGYLVAVAGGLCAALGYLLFRAYQETSRVVALSAPDAGDALAHAFARGDLSRIVALAAALAVVLVVLLVSSVVVTHRIAGPAFALKQACQEVGAGRLARPRPLRSTDLLRDLGEALAAMIDALRAREARDRDAIAGATAVLRAPQVSEAERVAALAALDRLAAEKGRRLAP